MPLTETMPLKLFLFFLFSAVMLNAQNVTLSGYVYDMASGETLNGVNISFENSNVNAQTNEYGFYSVRLPAQKYTVSWSMTGYFTETQTLDLTESTRLDMFLSSDEIIQLNAVVAEGNLLNKITSTQMGVEKLSVTELNRLPVLLGERDVVKTIKLLPGLKSGGAGESGISVRGGTADQNLISLDDAPVYNADHVFGFFSTFNSDVIKDVEIYKGTAPAEYGGRVSSFLDIRMKEGNKNKFETRGGLGLIFSRLSVEGPIQKEKSSFLLSGRRSYADLFLKLTEDFKDNQMYFYDLNAKLNFRLSDKDHLFVSGYYGRDVLALSDMFGIEWGNITQTLRYNRIWSDRLFSNTSAVYSNFDFDIKIGTTEPPFSIISVIQDLSLKHDFQFFATPDSEFTFGAIATHHANIPGAIDGLEQLVDSKEKRKGLESAAYISHDWRLSDNFAVNYGLRLSMFHILNGGTYYDFEPESGFILNEITDTGNFDAYVNLEPRLALNYRLSEDQALKAAYTRNTQNMHLISNSITATPSDRWIMSSNIIKPQISDQFTAGYFRNFNNKYEFSLEAYYKDMKNQIDFKDAASQQDLYVERLLRFGKGRAYGAEFLVRKNTGKLSGWIGYTWSRTEKLINGVNNDEWYLARQDRPHDLSVVGMYALNDKWNFSAAFIYQTGNAVTFPTGKYNIEGQTLWHYTERNGYRMPDKHRLDISATWTLKKSANRLSELVFGIFNVYARENAFAILFETAEDNPQRVIANQISLYKIVPSISYNFKF